MNSIEKFSTLRRAEATLSTGRILVGTADISGQPSGTSMKWKAVVANNKEQKIIWNVYRQKLRDIPQDFKNPEDVKWPKN